MRERGGRPYLPPSPAPVLLPSSLSAPSLLPARSAARWRAAPVGICLPLGAPPALAEVPPLPGAPVRGCAGSRASRLADAAGASGGSCGWRAHRVSSLHSGTPRSAPCLSRLPPLVGVGFGCGKPGRDPPGTPRRRPPSVAAPVRPGSLAPRQPARAWSGSGHRAVPGPPPGGQPARRLRPAGPEKNARQDKGSASGRRGCGPQRRAPGVRQLRG